MKCILLMNKSPEEAGGIDYVNYAIAMRRAGVDARLIFTETTIPPGKCSNVTVRGVPASAIGTYTHKKASLEASSTGLRLSRFIRREAVDFDILQIPAFPELGMVVWPLRRHPHSCCVLDIRTGAVGSARRNLLVHNMWRIQNRLFDGVIGIDEALLSKLRPLDKKLYDVVPLGFDQALFKDPVPYPRHRLGIADDEIVFLYVGSVSNERRIEDLLEVFGTAYERNNKVRLVLLPSDCQPLPHTPGSIILSPQKHGDVPSFIAMSDVGVAWIPQIPQFMSQPPLKTVEYLAGGLPVLGSPTDGNRRFVINGVNGLLTADNSRDQWLYCIDQMMSEKRRQAFRSNAAMSVEAYSYERIVRNKLLPFYSCLLSLRSRC